METTINSDKIGMFGISMSGYWGHRAAVSDRRIKAFASFEGVTGDFATIFERAQPSSKNNYMYMSSYTNEDDFDREIARKMPLGDLVAQIECPVLVGIGEFDELTRLEEAITSFERIKAPKELRVYEDEYHRLGGVAAEIIRFGGEWLERAMSGDLAEPGRRRAPLCLPRRINPRRNRRSGLVA
ncbi:alpha/beta hydrolase family protein [Novosphingobium gossypii]|uniref:hypothetical protein n=1 Tax=Novosphingobium gossypii TaxID=1604774 RepID=UPI003D1925EE